MRIVLEVESEFLATFGVEEFEFSNSSEPSTPLVLQAGWNRRLARYSGPIIWPLIVVVVVVKLLNSDSLQETNH